MLMQGLGWGSGRRVLGLDRCNGRLMLPPWQHELRLQSRDFLKDLI
jgi:hypothetical protein